MEELGKAKILGNKINYSSSDKINSTTLNFLGICSMTLGEFETSIYARIHDSTSRLSSLN
ncbi:MAG: hypothetical protein HC773_26460 [Scytonema sp. CRU_2_7]|nr:hypothetical protein [Scytonema sp. CRU_2_7]